MSLFGETVLLVFKIEKKKREKFVSRYECEFWSYVCFGMFGSDSSSSVFRGRFHWMIMVLMSTGMVMWS